MTALSKLIGAAQRRVQEGLAPETWLELLEELTRLGPAALPALVASVRTDEPLFGRGIAFTLARHGTDLPASRWLVGTWLIQSGAARADEGTAANTLNWIGTELAAPNNQLPALLRRAAGDHLVFAAAAEGLLQLALLDSIAPLEEQVAPLFTAETAAEFLARLPKHAPDDLTARDLKRLAKTLGGLSLPSTIAADPDAVAAVVEATQRHAATDLTGPQRDILAGWLERLSALEEHTGLAIAKRRPIVELRLRHSGVTLREFGELASSLERLLSALGRTDTPVAYVPQLTPLTASPGSFSLRALAGTRPADRKAVSRLMTALENIHSTTALQTIIGTQAEAWKRLRQYLELIAKQPEPVETNLIDPAGSTWRRISAVAPNEAETAVSGILKEEVVETQRIRARGTLVAANLRTGSFAARVDSYGDVEGDTTEPGELNRARLGQGYAFLLERARTRNAEGIREQWRLVGLEREEAGDESIEADAELPLGKGDVPQAKLQRAVQVAKMIRQKQAPTPARVGVRAQRNVDYYLHAARVLGLLDRDNSLTAFGRMALRGDEDHTMLRLALRFEESRVAQAWLEWAGVSRLQDVDPRTAAEFLAERSSLQTGTIDTRAGYLRKWHALFLPYWERTEHGGRPPS